MNSIKERIDGLRRFMESKEVAAFIVPSTDPHAGEYVPAHWESRKWISGFTGSAGIMVVTKTQAGLWTDSRYFLQASAQLQGTGITLFKERIPGTPSITEWLCNVLHPGERIGIDGEVNNYNTVIRIQSEVSKEKLTLVDVGDPFRILWTDRLPIPLCKPFIHTLQYAGVETTDKLEQIRQAFKKNGATGILLSALDEIAWTLNMRGTDVHCNPVFVSYLLVTESNATLYIAPEKLTEETSRYLQSQGIEVRPYNNITTDIRNYPTRLQLSDQINFAIAQAAMNKIIMPSPVLMLKAIKNETEIQGFHEAMKRDGIAMVKFLIWLKDTVRTGDETEISIDRKLYDLRAEQPLFRGISFDTIAGYQSHGAIVHYEATPETDCRLKPEGLLLLDSGAQYDDGTTDITRTIVLGKLTDEQRKDYTLVLKGFIALSTIEFPEGTCGTQLDVLARQFMWKAGINYGHGTGHGVGHFLNVHEGPHQIRMNYMPAPIRSGMTVTNEPGIYRTGKYGIRTENTMLVIKSKETEFGNFYRFEPLTLCPIDKEAILIEELSTEEKEWLNAYHQKVYDTLSPFLNANEQAWLKEATAAL